MKHDWHNVGAEKCFANVFQEIDITISNHNGFLVNERFFCSVQPLELGYAKWTWNWFWSRNWKKPNWHPSSKGEGFLGGTNGQVPACQCRRHKRCRFHPWVGKIRWRRAWQPTPVFLPGRSPWTEEPGRLQSIGSQRVRHHWSDLACMHWELKSREIPADIWVTQDYLISWKSMYIHISVSSIYHHLEIHIF